jgi:hypothetical protein
MLPTQMLFDHLLCEGLLNTVLKVVLPSKEKIKNPINPLNAKLNPICHLLALLGAHPIRHVSRIGVNVPGNNAVYCKVK